MDHTCHAYGCTRKVHPRYFMCRDCWYLVRPELQQAIYREYREGQERDKKPSARYMAVQRQAIAEVILKSKIQDAPKIAGYYLEQSLKWRRICIDREVGDPLANIMPS